MYICSPNVIAPTAWTATTVHQHPHSPVAVVGRRKAEGWQTWVGGEQRRGKGKGAEGKED
jgi:hypothetical protein